MAVLWHFLIFCCFCGRFLRIFNPIFGFLIIKCWMKYAEWPIYATSEHKTELWKITKNEIVLPPKHGAPPPSPRNCIINNVEKSVQVCCMKLGFLLSCFTLNMKNEVQAGTLINFDYSPWWMKERGRKCVYSVHRTTCGAYYRKIITHVYILWGNRFQFSLLLSDRSHLSINGKVLFLSKYTNQNLNYGFFLWFDKGWNAFTHHFEPYPIKICFPENICTLEYFWFLKRREH